MSSDKFFCSGRYRLRTVPHEMKMSHWVYAPVLSDEREGHNILDLSNGAWDLIEATEDENKIILSMARYPDSNDKHQITLLLTESLVMVSGKAYPISETKRVLNENI